MRSVIPMLMLLLCSLKLSGADDGVAFFENRIRPLFHQHCQPCHGPEKQKGGLRLDRPSAIQHGGDGGPILVPGKPDDSRILRAVSHQDPEFRMPPKEKLSDRQIDDLARWIRSGAQLPPDTAPEEANPETSTGPLLRRGPFALTDDDRRWWSFQPVRKPAHPATTPSQQSRHPVDALLQTRLDAAGLTPNPPATRRELIRRAYFDLIGLPPTPEAVESFETDTRPDAWERLIDSLLARPEYGERWARHWLDLVRFAESNGYERDGAKPHAWRYRDYVVRAFNEDKPYDQFVLEQLAGDELPGRLDPDRIVATGFYRLHVWDDEPDSTLVAEFDDLDDIMVTTGAAFLGLTVGCARCHDHKFDPISQADYYRLLAFVRSINPYGLHHTGGGGRGTGRITRPLASPEEVNRWETDRSTRLKVLRDQLAALPSAEARKPVEDRIREVESQPPPYPVALAVQEDPIKPTHLLRRGEVLAPGPEVQPAFPEVFGSAAPHIAAPSNGNPSSGRRLAFARWIASDRNPLTARVLVNRVWQHLFGRGLVPTPNDFGRTGLPPTHPELLDHLASEFVDSGWHLKRLHKYILLSQAYRMSSRADNAAALATDEANQLFWRQNPRRLEAEPLRDTLLAIAGALNLRMGGPGFYPALPPEVHRTQDSSGKGWGESPPAEQDRRSLYIFAKRALLPPLLEAFDYTTTTVPVGARNVTTVAPQALMLLNDSFVQHQAARLARRLALEAGPDAGPQIRLAFRLALQRQPTPIELTAARDMLQAQHRLAADLPSSPPDLPLRNFCVALLNLNELIYVD